MSKPIRKIEDIKNYGKISMGLDRSNVVILVKWQDIAPPGGTVAYSGATYEIIPMKDWDKWNGEDFMQSKEDAKTVANSEMDTKFDHDDFEDMNGYAIWVKKVIINNPDYRPGYDAWGQKWSTPKEEEAQFLDVGMTKEDYKKWKKDGGYSLEYAKGGKTGDYEFTHSKSADEDMTWKVYKEFLYHYPRHRGADVLGWGDDNADGNLTIEENYNNYVDDLNKRGYRKRKPYPYLNEQWKYAKGGKLMDYEISYGDKKYEIPRYQTHKMYKAKSDKEALKKIDEMEKEGFMVDEINNRTTDKAVYNTDLGIGLRRGKDFAKGGKIKLDKGERNFLNDLKTTGDLLIVENNNNNYTHPAQSTDRVFSDGVPVLKHIDRAPVTSIPMPTGKFNVIYEKEYGWWYFKIGNIWYGIELEDSDDDDNPLNAHVFPLPVVDSYAKGGKINEPILEITAYDDTITNVENLLKKHNIKVLKDNGVHTDLPKKGYANVRLRGSTETLFYFDLRDFTNRDKILKDFQKLSEKPNIYLTYHEPADWIWESSHIDEHDFAKGGKVEKKGSEMIMGGLAGVLLGFLLNK